MHRDFEKDGLVLMTLDVVIDEGKGKAKGEVLAFLKKQDATCRNYIFDDKEVVVDLWQTKHGVEGTPAFVAFDRDGKAVAVPEFPGKVASDEHAAAERKWVKELLERK